MLDRRNLLKAAAAGAAAGAVTGRIGDVGAEGAAPPTPRLTLRRAAERGHVNHGWLDTWHTFSFASYYDPAHMGFRALRVINDDKIAAGKGFPMHPHKDMEIVTYVLAGALQHKDSLGNGGKIVPNEVQRMSAGSGIFHSEFNASGKEQLHLLQIWMVPNKLGITPGYGQKAFPVAERQAKLKLVASPDGRDGSITIQSDTNLYAALLSEGDKVRHANPQGRHVWLHVAKGKIDLNGTTLSAGDAASPGDAGPLLLTGGAGGAEVLLFDLA
jgi:redox-sensitive bicupin YhaK (pirin superfamily)